MNQDLKNTLSLELYNIIAVEDGYFKFEWKTLNIKAKTVLCILHSKGLYPQNVKLKLITVDGMDATEKFLEGLEELNLPHINLILLGGITFAGFNIIDPIMVHERVNAPIVIVTDVKPSDVNVEKALKSHFKDWNVRLSILRRFRSLTSIVEIRHGNIILYVQPLGLDSKEAVGIVKSLIVKGSYPEPLRVAKMIASATSRALINVLAQPTS